MRARCWVAGLAALSLALVGCSSPNGTEATDPTARTSATVAGGHSHSEYGDHSEYGGHSGHEAAGASRKGSVPLRPGERYVDVAMPEPYSPSARGPGTDDYRCFLLDPEVAADSFVTGIDVVPGRADLVHHVILFRVPPAAVASAQAHDQAEAGQGWTCFGGSGLDGAGASLDDAPWLGAWAPGGGEGVLPRDVGIPLAGDSRIVMQVHYNLLAGQGPDQSRARLRIASGDERLDALQTMLLPAPVELPCRPGRQGRLCDREAAVADVQRRFGEVNGAAADFLNLMCGGTGPSPVQTCSRRITERSTVRAAAGHMHLLGRSIRIELNPGRHDARTVLDLPVWNFDDQASRPLRRPVRMRPGDELRVTCRHDQALRDVLPALQGTPERYVVWGEGTTDEMCLGVVLVTRP